MALQDGTARVSNAPPGHVVDVDALDPFHDAVEFELDRAQLFALCRKFRGKFIELLFRVVVELAHPF